MSYYFSRTITGTFDGVLAKTIEALKEKGFGVVTEINFKEVLKKKIDVDFRNYRVLGACNPHYAHQALQHEDKIGLMLPCNVLVQQKGDQLVEVAVIDPVASMAAVDNDALKVVAASVRDLLNDALTAI